MLIVGSQVAPAGYAWAFPWGKHRVRIGVGILHSDSDEHPDGYLKQLCKDAEKFGMDLRKAQPLEYHYGLIPAEGLLKNLVGNGIMGVGDAAGQASSLVGEGIRWAMKAGRMAGQVAADAIRSKDVSRSALDRYQKKWRSAYARNLRIAYEINKKIAAWDDSKWNEKTELLKLFTPYQFGQAIQSNFVAGWVFSLLLSHPRLMKEGFKEVFDKVGLGSLYRSKRSASDPTARKP